MVQVHPTSIVPSELTAGKVYEVYPVVRLIVCPLTTNDDGLQYCPIPLNV